MVGALAGETAMAVSVSCASDPDAQCYGTKGNDKLIGSNRVDIMHGRAGDDILKGFGGEDNGLLGEKGNDELRGGSDRDALSGGPGKDMLNGGEGNDLYYYLEPGWGHDRITDTAIVDNDFRFGNALSFEFVPNIGDLTINLNPGNKPEVSNGDGTSTVSWEGPIIDNLASGDGDDKIVGNDADNSIRRASPATIKSLTAKATTSST
jgi:hypothetical protein